MCTPALAWPCRQANLACADCHNCACSAAASMHPTWQDGHCQAWHVLVDIAPRRAVHASCLALAELINVSLEHSRICLTHMFWQHPDAECCAGVRLCANATGRGPGSHHQVLQWQPGPDSRWVVITAAVTNPRWQACKPSLSLHMLLKWQ